MAIGFPFFYKWNKTVAEVIIKLLRRICKTTAVLVAYTLNSQPIQSSGVGYFVLWITKIISSMDYKFTIILPLHNRLVSSYFPGPKDYHLCIQACCVIKKRVIILFLTLYNIYKFLLLFCWFWPILFNFHFVLHYIETILNASVLPTYKSGT